VDDDLTACGILRPGGAQVAREDRERAASGIKVLLEIADGTRAHDFEAVADATVRRGEHRQ
jgi:hypothetical protein